MFGDLDELFIPVKHSSLPAMLADEMGKHSDLSFNGIFYHQTWAMNKTQLRERYRERHVLPNISMALVTKRRDR